MHAKSVMSLAIAALMVPFQPNDEAAYREAFRLAGDVAYKKFGQV